MGVYSEIDMGYEDDHPFEVNDVSVTCLLTPSPDLSPDVSKILICL